ncbi:hypothetical protein [Actinomyces ruminis]|uniref:Uncharacterized protein n=1 Tax=Actinomyces ruminis TaxID=1937003 RepID=A0ABX4MAN8_9ACTO|nr:hypothetical protein [Actinomyces ruminis]PHP52543.1 hypothetical protein BW737_008635 [Actinomyces ruminis]
MLVTLNDYGTQYKDWLNQRTTAEQDPQTAARTGRKWRQRPPPRAPRPPAPGTPGQARPVVRLPGRPGRYAPPHPRRAHHQPRRVRGAQVRDRLRHHRGATPDHQAAIAEWTLYTYTDNPAPARNILADWHAQRRPERTRTPKPKTNKPASTSQHPAGWGTTPTPEQGLERQVVFGLGGWLLFPVI